MGAAPADGAIDVNVANGRAGATAAGGCVSTSDDAVVWTAFDGAGTDGSDGDAFPVANVCTKGGTNVEANPDTDEGVVPGA